MAACFFSAELNCTSPRAGPGDRRAAETHGAPPLLLLTTHCWRGPAEPPARRPAGPARGTGVSSAPGGGDTPTAFAASAALRPCAPSARRLVAAHGPPRHTAAARPSGGRCATASFAESLCLRLLRADRRLLPARRKHAVCCRFFRCARAHARARAAHDGHQCWRRRHHAPARRVRSARPDDKDAGEVPPLAGDGDQARADRDGGGDARACHGQLQVGRLLLVPLLPAPQV
mmetsp:Transcript_19279/g.62969  ORF Transcript_19279/g.62969 Transcript_19279/m.62969 type:complete len:231 (+) Transcript_19279:64-756(+)